MSGTMNGAESLVRTLISSGITVSFSNPGTSEMHFVAALDRVDGMRCVLCLHETVATGAADGYYRMTGIPASTLLHLGPGLGNALANLHNLRRARSGVVNIVGDHATYHRQYDAPLTSDIEGIARTTSDWVKTCASADDIAADGAAAVTEAMQPPGRISTLILPADTAWTPARPPVKAEAPQRPARVAESTIAQAAAALGAGRNALIMLGSTALRDPSMLHAARLVAKTGARIFAETTNGRVPRGVGRLAIERMPFPIDQAIQATRGVTHIVLVGAQAPVAFFAYPGKPSLVYPPDAEIVQLASAAEDGEDALARLVERMAASAVQPVLNQRLNPTIPTGPLTLAGIGAVLCNYLPDNAIVTDESVTTGRSFFKDTHGAAAHDWLALSGGAIGEGLPLAVGAAIACPDRKVIALQADGSAMYSLQALWTMAREQLDVTVCIWANRQYAILNGELANVGAVNPGRKARDMLSLDNPDIDWVDLARGMGVPATRVADMAAFAAAFRRGCSEKGPRLIEVVL